MDPKVLKATALFCIKPDAKRRVLECVCIDVDEIGHWEVAATDQIKLFHAYSRTLLERGTMKRFIVDGKELSSHLTAKIANVRIEDAGNGKARFIGIPKKQDEEQIVFELENLADSYSFPNYKHLLPSDDAAWDVGHARLAARHYETIYKAARTLFGAQGTITLEWFDNNPERTYNGHHHPPVAITTITNTKHTTDGCMCVEAILMPLNG